MVMNGIIIYFMFLFIVVISLFLMPFVILFTYLKNILQELKKLNDSYKD